MGDLATINGIPVYDARVGSDGTGMLRISLVDDPAVCSGFVAMAAERKRQLYRVEDEERRLVFGVVMRADFPIYRRDNRDGEYYVIYRGDTIRQMAEQYLADGRQNEVNLMHKDGSGVDGVQMVQWFIKDGTRGLSPDGFGDIADGSLFAEFHVTNDDVWDEVKAGTYKGFSLEGVFDFVPDRNQDRVDRDAARAGEFGRQTNFVKMRISKIKAALVKVLAQFGSVTTDKGVLVWDGDEDLKEGDAVSVEAEDGSTSQAGDGEYKTPDNKTIVVADGKVAEIRDPEAEVAPADGEAEEFGSVDTDKGRLEWDGDGDLAADMAVYTAGEDGERAAAADGDYVTADGKVIRVKDGKVTEISDDRAEVAARRMRQAYEMTYDEKVAQLVEAVAAKGYADFYVAEAADDHVVICTYDEVYNPKYVRIAVSRGEDDSVELGAETEVKPAFVPVDYDPDAAAGENAELRRQVEELKAQPLAKPVKEVVQTAQKYARTGNKGLDRLASILEAGK